MLVFTIRFVVLASLFSLGLIEYCFAKQLEPYKRVEALLKEKGANKEPKVYLDAVDAQLKKQLTTTTTTTTTTTIPKAGTTEANKTTQQSDQKAYIDALKQVAAYRLLLDEKSYRCNISECKVVESVARNSNGYRYIEESERVKLIGLDSLVHTVGIKHANYCRNKYLDSFKIAYSKLDKNLKLLAEFKKPKLEKLEKSLSKEEFIKVLIDWNEFSDNGRDEAEHLLEMTKNISKEENKCEFNKIFSKYLFEPCEKYHDLMLDIESPLECDSFFFKNKFPFAKQNATILELYKSIVHSKACFEIGAFGELEGKIRSKWEDKKSNECPRLRDQALKLAEKKRQQAGLLDPIIGLVNSTLTSAQKTLGKILTNDD